MSKLIPMYRYNSKGEKLLNCYYITIPKKYADKSKIDINKNVKITIKNKKIILEENNG